MSKLRFSLRGLLILTALVAAFCLYRDQPRRVANRFVAAIEAGDYREAEAMFRERVGISNQPTGMGEWTAARQSQLKFQPSHPQH